MKRLVASSSPRSVRPLWCVVPHLSPLVSYLSSSCCKRSHKGCRVPLHQWFSTFPPRVSLSSGFGGEAHPGGSREDPDPPLTPEKNLHHHRPEPLPVRREQRPHQSGLHAAGPSVPQLTDCRWWTCRPDPSLLSEDWLDLRWVQDQARLDFCLFLFDCSGLITKLLPQRPIIQSQPSFAFLQKPNCWTCDVVTLSVFIELKGPFLVVQNYRINSLFALM